jgi:riboflavin biosynthesis pyrimidine reductase
MGLYYELAAQWEADAMLSGSNTVPAFVAEVVPAEDEATTEPWQPNPHDPRPWLVIVDSHGRLDNLARLRRQPYWRDAIILCSHATPPTYLDRLRQEQIEHLVTGEEQVDLRAPLIELQAGMGLKRYG